MSATLTGNQTTDSHPVTVMLLRVLKKGESEPYTVDKDGQARLTEQLGQYLTGKNLEDAATIVANLAYFMGEKKGCDTVARALLAATEQCVRALEARGIDTGVARATLQDVGRKFSLFMGNATPLTAPMAGQPAPAGSFKAAALQGGPPRRK